ncbi:hypothetical protein Tco_1406459 [Tanacetum coccineum]
MAPLPPREQRHRFLRYEGLEYTDSDITDFEGRLARIHMREVHRVPVFDFGGLPDLMAEGLTARMFGQAILDLDTPGTLQFQLGGARRHSIPGQGVSKYWMGNSLLEIPCTILHTPRLDQAPAKGDRTDLFYLRGRTLGRPRSLRVARRWFRLQNYVDDRYTCARVAMSDQKASMNACRLVPRGAGVQPEEAPIDNDGDQALSGTRAGTTGNHPTTTSSCC